MRSFYARPTIDVARGLLGKVLVHGPTAGVIVETEAYLGGGDLASHSASGLTARTRVIFGPPGHAYVYFIYGMYECLNLVAEAAGEPGCVLIRALQPVAGIDLMQRRRPAARKPEQLANGPGKLTLAMGITRLHNGADVTRGALVVREPVVREPVVREPVVREPVVREPVVREPREAPAFEIAVTPRIGITKCADLPLRFLIAGNRFVSPARAPKLSRED